MQWRARALCEQPLQAHLARVGRIRVALLAKVGADGVKHAVRIEGAIAHVLKGALHGVHEGVETLGQRRAERFEGIEHPLEHSAARVRLLLRRLRRPLEPLVDP